ncbi:23S rRNA (pseudouridine(1915)-N(3))-methyltransferase RlmH [Thioalkalivibrio sulfidiphilus]|uniref:Ribosomal RNA large subunit methyltransferase H n=1 Tax=Thioalkalivibrio sulfidiphilus (strain HL-EbGR7) TaxID=396588 RepID=RLMH_THISH|nr:23S rRNA (pseudouridine(1915)-N(3))-methyltransferase RlmH [Thioalkalivibrio sulfidiphilus]B8GV07.1 RecName: Full=Ribosomal RNA large subunit methyltransferase H; AltName: Full=23S rRNA (pseudouridine1915-N3)-methyltransferase; AltName: Full=23S rRNA m3Psi1915 methyltransferase; AltName: Full=rRNA (pseudouridine-N3-)-methyltransferase RlmH [Thioalkalivibrio sulfidiphilus HL-EbGr7]ACL73353.1 SPOUT methyltransferase superfamily protein [Thioalkalivibrio sulfidiphilus HL-EbGr7]
MRIHLIAVGERMPAWVNAAYAEYANRLPAECSLNLKEIPAVKRGKNADLARIAETEGARMLEAIPKDCLVVALDEKGRSFSTAELSRRLDDWMHSGRDLALLVGGPEGLTDACRARADLVWSLSPLTFPHPLVRVILAEQVYRAWSLLRGHPYHRE